MKKRNVVLWAVFPACLLALTVGLSSAQGPVPRPRVASQEAPSGTAFTYQGQLETGTGPASGTCELAFSLYDGAEPDGVLVGGPITVPVSVAEGLFTASLDFGASVFDGDPRWLGIAVRCAGDPGFGPVLPRQALTAAPYALYARSAGAASTALTATQALYAHSADAASSALTATQALTAATVPWGGISGVPEGLADGTDNDTTYSAGFGLALEGNELRVVTSSLQTRVQGSCGAGSSIRAVNADGTVVCEAGQSSGQAASPAPNAIATVDALGTVGEFASATIGRDGRGLISYHDQTNGNLKVAHCDDATCTGAAVTTLDGEGGSDVGQYSSIAIGADGLGLISYYDSSAGDLKVAHCNNAACSGATVSTLDAGSGGNVVGQYSSIAIGSDGLGIISYYDQTAGDLKVAHCADAACATAAVRVVDSSSNNVGQHSSIAIGADGLAVVAYYDATGQDLRFVHCNNVLCTSASPGTLHPTNVVGEYASVAIGADGFPLIVFYDRTNLDLMAMHCTNLDCSTHGSGVTLDTGGLNEVGLFTAITIGADGLGLISYYDASNQDLRVAHCKDVACSGVTSIAVDGQAGNVGKHTSITIGSDGLPLIAYYDHQNLDLKVAHCGSGFCVPYFRRR